MAIPERRYTSTEAQARLTGELAAWSVVEGHLSRDYRVNGFKSALLLANAIGHLAELAWHHPDLVVRYGGLTVRLRTHSADAITEKDFALARRIEEWWGGGQHRRRDLLTVPPQIHALPTWHTIRTNRPRWAGADEHTKRRSSDN